MPIQNAKISEAEWERAQEEIERLRDELADHKDLLEEMQPIVEWYAQIQATRLAIKIAFAAVGTLLGLILSVLMIINNWPGA